MGSLALNEAGQILLTWSQLDAGGQENQLFKAERAANGAWTLPTDQNDFISVPGLGLTGADFAFNDAGQAVVGMIQESSLSWIRDGFLAERAANGTWSLPASASDSLTVKYQQILATVFSLNDLGQGVAAWIQHDGTDLFLHLADRESDGSWSYNSAASSALAGFPIAYGKDEALPRIAINAEGEVLLVWRGFHNGEEAIYKAERAANGTWSFPANGGDILSFAGAGVPVGDTALALNDAGVAVVAWTQSDGNAKQVFRAERAGNGTWTQSAGLNDPLLTASGDAGYLRLALNAAGQAVLVWVQSDGSEDHLYKAERAANGTWSVPADLNDHLTVAGTFSTQAPRLALNGAGQALVTWGQDDGLGNGGTALYKAERAANGVWSLPSGPGDSFSFLGPDQRSQTSTTALHEDGRALIMWNENSVMNDYASENRIYVAERAANGTWSMPSSDQDTQCTPGSRDLGAVAGALHASGGGVLLLMDPLKNIYRCEKADAGASWILGSESLGNSNAGDPWRHRPPPQVNARGEVLFIYPSIDGVQVIQRAPDGSF